MSTAWEAARASIERAQRKQKSQYDKKAETVPYKEGDLVYLFMPAKTSKTRKLERPNEGPFKIIKAEGTCVELSRAGKGRKKKIIRVAWDRLRPCPPEMTDPGDDSEPWKGRLRPRVNFVTCLPRTTNNLRPRDQLIHPLRAN